MLGLLKRIPSWLVFVALAFGALYYVEQRGYERRNTELAVEHARQLQALERQYSDNLLQAQRQSEEAHAQAEQIKQTSTQRIKTLNEHLKSQQQIYMEARHARSDDARTVPKPQAAQDGDPVLPLLGASVLDDHTVRLLDNARANRTDESRGAAGRADEEGRATAAAAPVTGIEFAENDLSVVGLYHQLAARHDALVDWVNQQCVNQTRQSQQP